MLRILTTDGASRERGGEHAHTQKVESYNEQKWLDATAQLIAEDSGSLRKFIDGDMTIFNASQFNRLGGVAALSRFEARENVFEALRQSSLVRQSLLASSLAA
jgi:hypothetical protein